MSAHRTVTILGANFTVLGLNERNDHSDNACDVPFNTTFVLIFPKNTRNIVTACAIQIDFGVSFVLGAPPTFFRPRILHFKQSEQSCGCTESHSQMMAHPDGKIVVAPAWPVRFRQTHK